jgi:signal transduction histidine kinase
VVRCWSGIRPIARSAPAAKVTRCCRSRSRSGSRCGRGSFRLSLTGGITHDFNNLIAEITGSLGLIRRRLDAGRTGEIDQFITGAIKAANSAGVLTHRLLAFARRQSLDIKSTDMNALIIGMADMLRRTLGKSVTLETLQELRAIASTDVLRPSPIGTTLAARNSSCPAAS